MKFDLSNNLYRRVILLSIIPAAIISIGITIYFTSQRISDTNALLEQSAEALAKQIASENINHVFSGNTKALDNNIQFHLKSNADLFKIEIFSNSGLLLSKEKETSSPGKQRIYQADIQLIPLSDSLGDFEESSPEKLLPVKIGKTIIHVSDKSDFNNQELFIAALITVFAIILISILTGLYLSRKIYKPISQLVNAFVNLGNKKFDTRVKEDSSQEILVMQKGFNEMAASLENMNDQIDREVTQITNDLNTSLQALEIQNIELDIARKEAIESTRIKSKFLANMSHEIRTPMNGIIGFTSLLRKSGLNEKQHSFVDTIEQSSTKLLQILNDILDYSKLEAGKIKINQLPFNLKDTVTEVVNLFTPLAHEKKLHLLSIIYNDVPTALIGDSLRVAQILSNLLSNAIKYTYSGEIILRVAIAEENTNEVLLSFSVSDTGVGISEEEQKSLFNPFRQLENELNRNYSGTGLGLSISNSLTTMMGGNFELESKTGVGSTFTVFLPFRQDKSEVKKILTVQKQDAFEGLNALIYDDHQLSRTATNNLLQHLGFQTQSTADSVEFIRLKNLNKFDLNFISIAPYQLDDSDILKGMLNRITDENSIILISSSDDNFIEELSNTYHRPILISPVSEKSLKEIILFSLNKDKGKSDISEKLSSVIDFSNLNILVVDDNDVNQKLLASLLENTHANIISAYNGLEAVNLIENNNIDLAFMDIHMPIMNGIDATKIIRQSGRNFPVIALTADAGFTNTDTLIEQGFNGVLIKPVNVDNLRNIITQIHRGENISIKQNSFAEHQSNSDHKELPIRDRKQALRITDNQLTVANKLLHKLVDELPAMLKDIDQYLNDKNWKELWQTLHRIHGSASVCAVLALAATVKELQQMIDRSEYSKLQEGLKNLEYEYKRLKDYSDKLPKENPPV
ncbi:MAG: response regulator [Gammaproteobacteria bacterium]